MSSPQRQDSESTRERILAAALEIFSEQGFEGARTRDIAERADANLGLIKYYFDTKESLWKAAVDRAFAELVEGVGSLDEPDGSDDREFVEQLIRRFVRFSARNPAFMRLMNDEGKRDGPRMRWLVKRHVGPVYEALKNRIERLREGFGPDLDPVSLHYIVVGACGIIFSQAPECRELTGVDPTTEDRVEAHADTVVALLLPPRDESA